ncbi:TetR/AcrR family transcriptional regulator [Nonomuraea sp. NPDC050691]|uniref:TetR/AcrR family transcriptional regulator n=1 Tax=Nonomuraea sp. NPDC050691 TaxID=3155661 RepID=UPI00340747EF
MLLVGGIVAPGPDGKTVLWGASSGAPAHLNAVDVDPAGGARPRSGRRPTAALLDVAAGLLLRHGYRRVTIDDVAAGAEIGKDTVYLHWKTRAQLFGAVFTREVCFAMDELRRALLDDPRTCLVHRFARVYFLAVARRPLLRGFLLADAELTGKLTAGLDERHAAMAHGYFDLLAGHRLLREDMGVEEVGFSYQATFEGFLRASDDGRASHDWSTGPTCSRAPCGGPSRARRPRTTPWCGRSRTRPRPCSRR